MQLKTNIAKQIFLLPQSLQSPILKDQHSGRNNKVQIKKTKCARVWH